MAAAFGLILYAASIVSNAFGSPVFSFFQLSYSVAHGVVLYSAVNLAVFLGLGVLIIGVYDTLKGGVAVDSGSQAAEEGEGSGQVLADTAWAFGETSDAHDSPSFVHRGNALGNNMVCGRCKTEVKEPIFKVNYVNSLPRLVWSCPLCGQPLGLDQSSES